MKKFSFPLLFALLLLSATLTAQPIITNAEDYSIGTTLQYQQCDPAGITAGNAGANITWNFSALPLLPDTITGWVIPPSDAPHGNQFTSANQVEKYSDGRFIYIIKTASENFIAGYADDASNLLMTYSNPMLITRRPFTYGDSFADTFSANFTVAGFGFNGSGTIQAEADGYGTLILPNGTFNNVLRLKFTTQQTDTLLQFGTTTTTHTISYQWFDAVHASALLKIDSVNGDAVSSKSVEFLLNETITGAAEIIPESGFKIYPNPANGFISISVTEMGELRIINQLGQIVQQNKISGLQTTLPLQNLPAGTYAVNFRSQNQTYTVLLAIQ